MNRKYWPKWKDEINKELNSLTQRKVIGPVVHTPNKVRTLGHEWVFVRKRNEKNEVVRYKAILVAQGFTQRPEIDYEETYSPVVDAITFSYFISLTTYAKLEMCLMDVFTAYLYGSLENDIYMKIPEGFKVPEAQTSNSREVYLVKLNKSLYRLKQSGRMCFNCFSTFLLKECYKNDPLSPCVFIKRSR